MLRVGVLVRGVGITLPSRTVGIRVWIALQWGIKIMDGIGVLDGRRTTVAFNGCVPLYTAGLAGSVDPN